MVRSALQAANGFRAEASNALVDLRPHATVAPFSVNRCCSVPRAYALFKALGARSLVVCDHHNVVVGVLPREHLATDHLARDGPAYDRLAGFLKTLGGD